MVFMNESETIGLIIVTGTQSVTGNIVATLLFIMAFLSVLCMMFSIPLEFSGIIILPYAISVGAYYSNMLGPLIAILIFFSSILAKNWLFR